MAFGGINIVSKLRHRNPSLAIKRLLRTREKLLLGAAAVIFLIICIGPILFMPELRGGLNNRVDKVYKQMQNVGPELILPPPPRRGDDGSFQMNRGIHKHNKNINDIHEMDKIRLRQKIESDNDIKRVLEKPAIKKNEKKIDLSGHPDDSENVKNLSNNGGEDNRDPSLSHPIIQDGQDDDLDTRNRRDKVKEMMLHAWNGYKTYAWAKNELRPISKKGHTAGIFGKQDMGASIVDAMDALYIMGLDAEYQEAKTWIIDSLDFSKLNSEMSVFETNIRFIGGLLSGFALTGEPVFREKALQIAKKLLPAFNTPTGIPYSLVNVQTGRAKNYAWASGSSSILSEFGTLHLEFSYLSDITGDPEFRDKVEHIRDFISKKEKPNGLYPNYIDPESGKWGQRHTSVGALGDSFYEYLVKQWVMSGGKDTKARDMYLEAMKGITQTLLKRSNGGFLYIAESKFDHLEHKMDHLACFVVGMLALGYRTIPDPSITKHLSYAADIADTCHHSYNQTATGLGPESFRFNEALEAKALRSSEKYYILRPEVVEGWFYMWRYTKDQKYRDWAWQVVQSLEKYCRSEAGYSGIQNVYNENSIKDDVQQSFLFAELFKYLYLIFSDSSLISLDEWVFNTEAHPLPIRGKNPLYRALSTPASNDGGETN